MEIDNLSLKEIEELQLELAKWMDWNKGEKMVNITGAEVVAIRIKSDGKVVWINTENGCVLRICKINKLILIDDRTAEKDGN